MASIPSLYNHGYDCPTSNPSVNAIDRAEEEKKKGHSHSHSHDKQFGKGAKKRSRGPNMNKASPTTFIEVDTSNFRAMVHHLTGFSYSSSFSFSSSSLYGSHGMASSSSISFLNPPHSKRPFHGQPDRGRETIYSSSLIQIHNPSVSASTPLLINHPFEYGNESSVLTTQEHSFLSNGELIVDDLDYLQHILLLDNTNDPSSTTAAAAASSYSKIVPAESPFHFENQKKNLESLWLSEPSLVEFASMPKFDAGRGLQGQFNLSNMGLI